MAKLSVLDPVNEGSATPFLRGILIRSLQNAGIEFDSAYAISSQIKNSFIDRESITTTELRNEVLQKLSGKFSDDIIEQYKAPTISGLISVINSSESGEQDESSSTFSAEKYNRCLYASGLTQDVATIITAELIKELSSKNITEVDSNTIGRMTCSILHKKVNAFAVQRYLTWVNFSRSSDPLHILIGGATGTGKSTIATEIAHTFGITRIQSTDTLREVMRMMVPERLVPSLHVSSFNAWQSQPRFGEEKVNGIPSTYSIFYGYLTQAEKVSVASNAIIQRAKRENVSLVLEGVHNHPEMMQGVKLGQSGIVVPLMLAVMKRKNLRRRIIGRGREASKRRSKYYIEHFDDIWAIQNFLLDESDQYDIPIIHNKEQDETLEQIMLAINYALMPCYDILEEKLFGK